MKAYEFLKSVDTVRLAYIAHGVAASLKKYKRLGVPGALDEKDKGFLTEGKEFIETAQRGVNPLKSKARPSHVAAFDCYINTRHFLDDIAPSNYQDAKDELQLFINALMGALSKKPNEIPQLDTVIKFFSKLGRLCLSKHYYQAQEQEEPSIGEMLV